MGKAGTVTLIVLVLIVCASSAEENADDLSRQVFLLGDDSVDVRWLAKRTLRRAGEKAVPALIEGLSSEDPFVRGAAAKILGTVTAGRETGVEALVKACADEDKYARESAVKALGWIGPAAGRAVPALEKAVRDGEHSVRRAGIKALGEVGAAGAPALVRVLRERAFRYPTDPSNAIREIGGPAVPALAAVLRDEKDDPWLRHTAALLLGKIGTAARDAKAVLSKTMRDPDPRVALAAAFAYWRATGDEEPVRPLVLKGLHMGLPQIRDLAMWVISEVRFTDSEVIDALVECLDEGPPANPSAVGPIREIGRATLPALFRAMKEREAPDRRRHVEALVEIRPLGPEAVPFLVEALGFEGEFDGSPTFALEELGACAVGPLTLALERGEPAIRKEAVRVLGRMGAVAREAVPALRKALGDGELRIGAARAIVAIAPDAPGIVAVLAEYARTEKTWRSTKAVEALALARPEEEARAELEKFLAHEKSSMREAAAMAIWKQSGDPTAALPFLIARLGNEANPFKYELSEVGRPAVAPILAELARKDFSARSLAFGTLKLIGEEAEEAVPYLIRCLSHDTDSIRCWAADALEGIGPAANEAAPALIRILLLDESRWARKSAAEALPLIVPGDERAEAALRKTLHAGWADLRRTAALALYQLAGDAETAVPVILDIVLDREATYDERQYAVLDLGKIGPPAIEALPTILKLLESRELYMAKRAAEAVAQVGGARPEVVTALLRTLCDRDWLIRKAAVRSLGRLGPAAKAAAAAVEARTFDRNMYVRETARKALALIRGE